MAGAALGVTLIAAILFTGHGLDTSDAFARLGTAAFDLVAPGWAEANRYFAPHLHGDPASGWTSWAAVGLLIGALAGSLSSGRFRLLIERGAGHPRERRLGWAFAGGVVVGLGAELGRGGVLGLGLSGGATLAVAAPVFFVGFFAAGFAAMPMMRRRWQ